MFEVGQQVLAFDNFGLALDKKHKHPTDDGAYWRKARILSVNQTNQSATISWFDGGVCQNKPWTKIKKL